MPLIVVCEDDASTRTLIAAVLIKAGYIVESFEDAITAYERLLEGDVELLISDVNMPEKNGFELIEDLRRQNDLVNLPCILLTSLSERAHMRVGMTSGADDYLTKPFQPSELLAAVDVQLKRAMQRYTLQAQERMRSIDLAVSQRTDEVVELYERRLQEELQLRWARSDMASTGLSGVLIGCAIIQQDDWQKALSTTQMADLAQHFFTKLADVAALFQAEHLQFVGDGVMIVFDANENATVSKHVDRAVQFINAMAAVRTSMDAYLDKRFGALDVPHFGFSLVAHEGEISLAKLDGVAGGIDQLVPVGQAMGDLSTMLKTAQSLRWHLAVSMAAWSSFDGKLLQEDQVQIQIKDKKQPLRRVFLNKSFQTSSDNTHDVAF
jgi:DNA-binding response OmpR family regulator